MTTEGITPLEACSWHALHPRQHRRAQAILSHHRGPSLGEMARFYAIRYATIHAWVQAWLGLGLAGLVGGKRAASPA